jgi:hypothetical protein
MENASYVAKQILCDTHIWSCQESPFRGACYTELMTRRAKEILDRLRELPDTVQEAAVDAILWNLDQHFQSEQLAIAEREPDQMPPAAKYGRVEL